MAKEYQKGRSFMAGRTPKKDGLFPFFVLTYVIMFLTWGMMAIFQIPGASASSGSNSGGSGGLLILLLGMFSTTISGIFMTWRVEGRAGLRRLWGNAKKANIGSKWYAALLLFPLLILGIRMAVYVLGGGLLTESALLKSPASLIGFTITIILTGPLAEEFGWRGFALERLLSRWSVLKANLVLGIIWAFWHLPLFFIPGTIQQIHGNQWVEFPIFALTVMGLNVFINWLFVKTDHSIFAAILVHFVFNWLFSFSVTFMSGGSIDRLVNAAAYAVLALIILIIWNRSNSSQGRKLVHKM
jgi:uncharacterized protein